MIVTVAIGRGYGYILSEKKFPVVVIITGYNHYLDASKNPKLIHYLSHR